MFAADSGMSPAYRLSPALMLEGSRSVEFGFLPDPFWPHPWPGGVSGAV
jgi:hypothetical protein